MTPRRASLYPHRQHRFAISPERARPRALLALHAHFLTNATAGHWLRGRLPDRRDRTTAGSGIHQYIACDQSLVCGPFGLYGLDRDDFACILDTFPIVARPIVARKDQQRWGEYRTKWLCLEAYDRFAGVERGVAGQRSAPAISSHG